MKKIALIGGRYCRNIGDMLIFDCAYRMLCQRLEELGESVEILKLDQMARKAPPKPIDYPNYSLAGAQTDAGQGSGGRLYAISPILNRNYKDARWLLGKGAKKYRAFCEKNLSDVDAIVFAGGGLFKFKSEGYHLRNYTIVKYAEKRGIPVYFNAVGAEGYDSRYIGCLLLKRVARSSCVKRITTRDYVELFRDKYKTTAQLEPVPDPAVFASQLLGIKKAEASQLVGVGAIRGKIFTDYGGRIDENGLIAIYKGVLEGLTRQNREWRLFTNGMKEDIFFALRLLDELGLPRELLLPAPLSSAELVSQIASFGSIIAGRMHACIAAYSLGVPAVGFCWNSKITRFGETIKHPERFVPEERLTAKELLTLLERAESDS